MEDVKLKGEIEVILEDKDGNILQREIHSNNITEGYLKYMFFDALNHGTVYNTLRSNIRANFNFIDRSLPSTFGIYALNTNIDIKDDTYLPPYVGLNMTALNSNVTFYNVNGSAIEGVNIMVPADPRCYFKYDTNEMVIEYIKNTNMGTVKSVCIGRNHSTQATFYSTAIRDENIPSEFHTALLTTNYILEHTDDETIIYKTIAATGSQMSFNTKTKEFISYNIASMFNNITNQFGALVVGNDIFKIEKTSVVGATHTATLTYVRNWKSNVTPSTFPISFNTRAGAILNTIATPVLVSRKDINKLEVFLVVSTGLHDTIYGCNIQKAIIDISDMDNLSYTIQDLGVFTYGVSNFTTSTVNTYMSGLYYDNEYYLPIYFTQDSSVLNTVATATYQDGIITSDFKNISNFVNFRTSAAENKQNVITENGVKMCRVVIPTIPYVFMSHVISGSNLSNAITKTETDILRIIYRYKIA